jgi:hypothetical protein
MATVTKKKSSDDGIITQFLIFDPKIGKIDVIHYVLDNSDKNNIKYYRFSNYTFDSGNDDALPPIPPKSTFIYEIDNNSKQIEHTHILGGIPHNVEACIVEGGKVTSKVTDLADI